ncbi:hypothetical protein BCR39DRAFT_541105 [Naematelia encephala]|uniref:Distal membrane-arm assembly complex protein 1-like domain-containing protein n=1 Tax=Naematelia encephala TaxID=71784 RepID=A0A1Y2AV96_9TREE|nr:hypothetical protein BCR39DRAFT_541105 [Naematelia encephala]
MEPSASPAVKTSQSTGPNGLKKEDCLACRLTGAATFSAIGVYALYEANKQGAFARVRPKGSPLGASFTVAIGVVFLSLGCGRLVI